MLCEKCHRERDDDNGSYYQLCYGFTEKSARDIWWANTREITTTYKLKDREGVWICDPCVNLRYNLATIGAWLVLLPLIALVLGFVIALIRDPVSPPSSFGFWCFSCCTSGMLIIFPIWLLIWVRGSRTELGENLALSLRKKSMKRIYDFVMTASRYARLGHGL